LAAEDIRTMSEQLAADPQSLVFIPLAEALLARGEQRGAAKHIQRADAHDLVARIALAMGDEPRAEDSWAAVLAIDPNFGTAHRGLGLVRFHQGRLEEAMGHLTAAAHDDPGDEAVRAALDAVQGVVAARDGRGASAAALFDPVLEETKQVALLLDADGLVAAGSYQTAEGEDLGASIGAHLSGVGDEADRAIRHFGLGKWTRIVIESEAAAFTMSPVGDAVMLVAAPRDVPLGFVRRTLERCVAVARDWLGGAS
jgi:predicted regulator of Ras-like GTPase activity (Roadblock/LC7/MglB family)